MAKPYERYKPIGPLVFNTQITNPHLHLMMIMNVHRDGFRWPWTLFEAVIWLV